MDKPFNITNFLCISNNWESLTCNWTKPENPIKTNYKINFRFPGSDNSNQQSTSNQTISVQGLNYSFNVTGLEYLFWVYVRTALSGGDDSGPLLLASLLKPSPSIGSKSYFDIFNLIYDSDEFLECNIYEILNQLYWYLS